MRDSNFRAVATNKASLTITLSMYDRRALDVPSDKPLVNLLNYLTYLVSSSPKVRETLANDGGIERLIEILHECHNSTFSSEDTIFNADKKVLVGWKWTLAFQCLVLVGTRGTEKIRQKVVLAGILPIIATVLDNYLSLNEQLWKHNPAATPTLPPGSSMESNSRPVVPSEFSLATLELPMNLAPAAAAAAAEPSVMPCSKTFDLCGDFGLRLTCDDYDSLSVKQLLKLIGLNDTSYTSDIRRRYLIAIILKKLHESKEADPLDIDAIPHHEYSMDVHLQFLCDLYLETAGQSTSVLPEHGPGLIPRNNNHVAASKMAVRNFTETGVIIPQDDDIIWSLQLLAYISKYPYLKEALQNTHLIIEMSIRDKHFKHYLENQRKLTMKKTLELQLRPPIPSKLQNLRTQRFEQQCSDASVPMDEELELSVLEDLESEFELDSLAVPPPVPVVEATPRSLQFLGLLQLYDSIAKAELIENDLERQFALCQVTQKIDETVASETIRLKSTITKKRQETKDYLNDRWNYETYQGFDVDDLEDQDELLMEYKRVNLFPLVERFTFLPGTDMYYWAGVIMRNLCRRNEARGGVRQCGNLECGQWEKFPREFSKCRRCKRTKYCSRDCQIKAWNCHRNWCIPSTSSSGSTSTDPNASGASQSADNS